MIADLLIQSLWSGVKQIDTRTWSLFGCILLLGLAFRLIQALADRGIDALVESTRGRRMRKVRRLEDILDSSAADFERLCRELFAAMGYHVLRVGGQRDGGVDVRATRTGETVLIQCKRWRDRPVGVKVVRELLGVVISENASQGILVTTSRFTPDAQSFAVGQPLVLIDRPGLIALIREYLPAALTDDPRPSPATQKVTVAEYAAVPQAAPLAFSGSAIAVPGPAPTGGFPIVCSACGKPDTVPFRPRGDKPLLCRSCYAARRKRR